MFSERLQNLRRQKGFSQEYFAENMGVSRQSVSKWESGQSYPDAEKIVLICELFDVSADYLLRGIDPISNNMPLERSQTDKKSSNNRKNIISIILVSKAIFGLFWVPFLAKIIQSVEMKIKGVCLGSAYYYIEKYPLIYVVIFNLICLCAGLFILLKDKIKQTP